MMRFGGGVPCPERRGRHVQMPVAGELPWPPVRTSVGWWASRRQVVLVAKACCTSSTTVQLTHDCRLALW